MPSVPWWRSSHRAGVEGRILFQDWIPHHGFMNGNKGAAIPHSEEHRLRDQKLCSNLGSAPSEMLLCMLRVAVPPWAYVSSPLSGGLSKELYHRVTGTLSKTVGVKGLAHTKTTNKGTVII